MNSDERKAWGPVIRLARQAADLTIEELAQYAGTTRQTIGAIENGRTAPQEKVLRNVLEVLGLRPITSEPDIEVFLGSIRPLLRRLDRAKRKTVMTHALELVAQALGEEEVTERTDFEAWALRWIQERHDGPWSIKREWQLRAEAPRFDVAILNRDGKLAGVIEVKRGERDPVTTSQALHQAEAYLALISARFGHVVADDPEVDIVWVPTTTESEGHGVRDVVEALNEVFEGYEQELQAAALQAWSDHLEGDDDALIRVGAEHGSGAVRSALRSAWDAPRRPAAARSAHEMQQLEPTAARDEYVPNLRDPEALERWLNDEDQEDRR